jgi:hypothetical protein
VESHLRVEITPRAGDSQHLVKIGDATFPVADFAVQVADDGTPMLSLALAPDSVSIGVPPAPAPAAPRASSWGDGSHPDPRAGIPGWEPPLGAQVANQAERVALRSWEPSLGQEWASAFKRLVRLGNVGHQAVTA